MEGKKYEKEHDDTRLRHDRANRVRANEHHDHAGNHHIGGAGHHHDRDNDNLLGWHGQHLRTWQDDHRQGRARPGQLRAGTAARIVDGAGKIVTAPLRSGQKVRVYYTGPTEKRVVERVQVED